MKQSNAAEEDFYLQESDVDSLLREYAAHGNFHMQARGKAGYAITFYGSDATRGEDRAARFVSDVSRNTKNIWCVVERPQELRQLQGRAHDFGGFFKKFCENAGRSVNTYYSLHGEFLVIGDVVIAPLPLIPAASSWHDVSCAICDVLETKPEKVNLRQPLKAQLWEYILDVICNAENEVGLIRASFGKPLDVEKSVVPEPLERQEQNELRKTPKGQTKASAKKSDPKQNEPKNSESKKQSKKKPSGASAKGKKRRKIEEQAPSPVVVGAVEDENSVEEDGEEVELGDNEGYEDEDMDT